jgi:hypothetical protein
MPGFQSTFSRFPPREYPIGARPLAPARLDNLAAVTPLLRGRDGGVVVIVMSGRARCGPIRRRVP